RKLPVIDGFASPVKIQQFTLNDYPIDYSFKYVTRFDRCTTCHLGADRANFDKEALRKLNPESTPADLQEKLTQARDVLLARQERGEKFSFDLSDIPKTVRTMKLSGAEVTEFCAHPRLDLFVDGNSSHPAEKFGCTSCHSGQPSATEFTLASHTPSTYPQMHEWKREHDWAPNHYWDYAMLAQRFVESTCIKCHRQVTAVAEEAR